MRALSVTLAALVTITLGACEGTSTTVAQNETEVSPDESSQNRSIQTEPAGRYWCNTQGQFDSYSLDLRYDNRAVLTTRDVFERPVFQQWSLTQQNTLLVGNSEYSFSQTGIETNLGSTTCSKTEDAFIPDDFQKQNPTYQCGLEYYTFHPDRSLYVDGILVDQWSRDVNAYSFTDEVFYLDTPEIMHRFWFRHACTHFSGPILVPITVDPIGVYDCTLGSITSTLEVRDDGVAQQHYVSVDVNTRPYEWYISEKTTLRFGASEFFFTDFGLESSFGETCIAQ